tara:strand:- start:283 stop:732 length:450 start_codon:yes stop_codon:yes gene_type:complete
MQNNYRIVNLINGLNIVGNVYFDEKDVIISYPLEVAAKPISDEKGNIIGENMVLRPYLVMTDDSDVIIEKISVISSSSLSERLFESYEQMVENVYNKPISFEGNFFKEDNKEDNIEELPEDIQAMNEEELDYLDEQLEKLIGDKKETYH